MSYIVSIHGDGHCIVYWLDSVEIFENFKKLYKELIYLMV